MDLWEEGGDFILHLFAGFEFDHGARWDRDFGTRFVRISAYFGLGYLDLKGAEIAENDIAIGREFVGDDIKEILNHIEDLLLGKTGLVADLDDKISFSDSGHDIWNNCSVSEPIEWLEVFTGTCLVCKAERGGVVSDLIEWGWEL